MSSTAAASRPSTPDPCSRNMFATNGVPPPPTHGGPYMPAMPAMPFPYHDPRYFYPPPQFFNLPPDWSNHHGSPAPVQADPVEQHLPAVMQTSSEAQHATASRRGPTTANTTDAPFRERRHSSPPSTTSVSLAESVLPTMAMETQSDNMVIEAGKEELHRCVIQRHPRNAGISEDLWWKIGLNQYLPLAEFSPKFQLLPDSVRGKRTSDATVGDVNSTSPFKSSDDIDFANHASWMVASDNAIEAIITIFPHRRQELVNWQKEITQLATMYPWDMVSKYDKSKRRQVAFDQSRYDFEDSELRLGMFKGVGPNVECEAFFALGGGGGGNTAGFNKSQQPGHSNQHQHHGFGNNYSHYNHDQPGRNVCKKYNDRGCDNKFCRYKHECYKCGDKHSMKDCEQKDGDGNGTSRGNGNAGGFRRRDSSGNGNGGGNVEKTGMICKKYNDRGCYSQFCRYQHACNKCGERHSAKECQADEVAE
ncbi:hypothetical protein HDU76_013243 [Blyttiomyces sp. JEL0837]|nr:hypothetical protein HDU76_013243 [Blyttiomyces sp. JEL0837]